MAVLTKEKILEEIKKGNIKIEPFSKENIGPASVDLTLGNVFRKFKTNQQPFKIKEEAEIDKITKVIKLKDGEALLMNPNETVLGITKEKITLSSSLSGRLEGRSRFARMGLGVHVTASFIQPGISNQQVLEMTNLSSVPLLISPGLKICQFIFERCEGRAKYQGRFKYQKRP